MQLNDWLNRISFPVTAKAPLGFGTEYWDPDPTHYEGWEQLRDRRAALGYKSRPRDLAYELASHLLADAVIAAGGVELAIGRMRAACVELEAYAVNNVIQATPGVPFRLGHPSATNLWYAFSEVLSWSRTVVERLDRRAEDSKRFPRQGLVPALKPKRLKKRCERLLCTLRAGPVGQARDLANFVLHTALVVHPQSGVGLDASGHVILPIPDAPTGPVKHWYLFSWQQNRDGVAIAEEMWREIQVCIAELIEAFERAVPRRLRK